MVIRIEGVAAQDIARTVRTYVRPGRDWREVALMSECEHGCKLHARIDAEGRTEYALIHYSSYGCAIGRTADAVVPVEVVPIAVRVPLPNPAQRTLMAGAEKRLASHIAAHGITADTLTITRRWERLLAAVDDLPTVDDLMDVVEASRMPVSA